MHAKYTIVQVKEPRLQARSDHSATAFCLSPGLTEVTLFGGCHQWPKNRKVDADLPKIAKTTVLRFGELIFSPINSQYMYDLGLIVSIMCRILIIVGPQKHGTNACSFLLLDGHHL